MLLIAVSLTLAILFLSLIRLNDLPDLKVKEMDKYYHAFAYFTLTISWLFFFQIKNKIIKLKFLFLLIIALTFFGIVIEILQRALTNYRLFDYQDMIANTIGVLIASSLFLGIRKKVF
jgi:VanZ family protein